MIRRARARAAYWRAVLVCWSYVVRPYDGAADRRRWAWQRRAPCGLGAWPPSLRAALVDALVSHAGRDDDGEVSADT